MVCCEDKGEGKGRGTGSYGIFKKMRRGDAKSCKNGLGRDNEMYLGASLQRILWLDSDGVTRNLTYNEFLGGEGLGRSGCGAAAPERGSYSRIGACPYLPPQLIDSRCCPCKGRISLAGLAPQYDSRYEPLTGARFINRPQEVGACPYPKYEPLSGALSPLYQS